MRLKAIQKLHGESCEITVINTQEIIDNFSRLARIFAYRFKSGPIVNALSNLKVDFTKTYNFVWIEKAVLFKPNFIQKLKKNNPCLIHFSPDPAFLFHKSKKFNKGIKFYDYLITTKSFESDFYSRYAPNSKTILVNQAYSPETHYISKPFKDRKKEIVFIGHYERNRGETLQLLLNHNFPVALAGRDWGRFVNKNKDKANFTFLGDKLYGDAYREALNDYQFSIGFLSEWIPEKHTTRTFEIPACGCILVTPSNSEISSFYDENEAIHYSSSQDLITKLKYWLDHEKQRNNLAARCYNRTQSSGYTHFDGIDRIFKTIAQAKSH